MIGMSWPLALSAPTALLIPFILVLYGPAVSVLEMRYLVGYYMDCCNAGEMLDPQVLAAGMTMACGVLVVSMVAFIASRGAPSFKCHRDRDLDYRVGLNSVNWVP